MSPGRPWLGVSRGRWLSAGLLLLALALASWLIRDALDLEWSIRSLRSAVASAGVWGPLLYVGVLVFRFAILVPSSLLLTGAGICFGPVHGTLFATIGLTLSALLKFGFASVVGRDLLIRQVPPSFRQSFAVGDRRSTATGLAVICAYPLGPNHVFQIAAILAGIPLGRYLLAVSSGAFVRAAAFSVFGEALVTGERLLLFSLALGSAALVPLLFPGSRRWLFPPAPRPENGLPREVS